MGGAIHSKGVLILSNFLAARYAGAHGFSVAASLVFEQSYVPVEGDSASLAELGALLSSLAETPIRQNLAVTGSVDQRGRVQPIGGVNEKIEGFFDVCAARGLTGKQGVIIPTANVRNLMLRRDVVEAVAAKKFAIYAVDHVDEALELLTGLPVGQRDESGGFPEGTLNRRVEERLRAFAKILKAQRRPTSEDGGGSETGPGAN
ncbi:MAG TPA: S16 family serine protease [Methylococcus sp.]|nr:S16 family serine protease [Methylococcus sp.]